MNPEEVVAKVLELREQMFEQANYGPFTVKIPSSIDLQQIYSLGGRFGCTYLDERLKMIV